MIAFMTETRRLSDYLAAVRARKAALGLDDNALVEKMRNPGDRRTADKRKLLDAIEARAREAGVEPIKSNY